MRRLSAATRISIGLTCLTMSLLLAAQGLGVIPNPIDGTLKARKELCESLAIHCSLAAQRNDVDAIKDTTRAIVGRNPDILSAALRLNDGNLVVTVGEHDKQWKNADHKKSTSNHVRVPILQGSTQWGTLEVAFKPAQGTGWVAYLSDPIFGLIAFVAIVGFIAYAIYLKKMLQHLDPSAVIPERIKNMLNTLAEGVLVLDRQERVVLANDAFASTVGRPAAELQGIKASTLKWTQPQSEDAVNEFPWKETLHAGSMQMGVRIGLKRESDARTFRVNCAPILGGDGSRRGALATFDDVTTIEEKSARLRQMLDMLQQSRDEINRQNQELQALATTDPLTGCMNRRSFFAEFEKHWSSAKRYGHALSCVMVDVDRFKSINDRHGHSVGDQVLRHVAQILKSMARDTDLVCRYGGEEFCILLPHGDLEAANQAAERYRKAIEITPCAAIGVTASFGVSSIALGARDPQDLLEQADKSLYFSKRSGRNRCTSFDQIPANAEAHKPEAPREPESSMPIPFHAVTALMSALAHRDAATADHCQRVADLAVATVKGLMSVQDSFLLEVAAMLHDIGKLGVPDAILLKPGPLTEEEWTIMRTHDQMGVEIISAAFGSKELTEIVRTHHAWYSGNPENVGLPTGQHIPLGARILSIADAFDAMVSERPYHRPKTQDKAFDELRRCAGRQFDPQLVERLIKTVQERDLSRIRPSLSVPQQTALRIRLEIERLACALDERDLSMLGAMAQHIAAVAQKDGLSEIAGVANTLERTATGAADLESVLKLTNELLELCRSPQSLRLPAENTTVKQTAA
ncbi:MAG TPA: diguanylate cyclase [Tepidisphaeraceae bacterium]|jgi:diguanylate cyclase (GGDEF)-like protein/putative nucleotidyltransferase with HDIG domain/PAS domain S-box-containing protein